MYPSFYISVLGVSKQWTGTDLNGLTAEGRYSTEANILNAPNPHSGNVIVLKRNTRIIQIWISNQDTSPTFSYIRVFIGSWGNWEQYSTDIPSFYKNYNDLAALSQGLANGYVQIPTNSFASLQGKNYPSFRWLNDNSSTPFGEDKTTIMGKCVTSLNDPNYTMIDIWHVASPQTIYHGMMQNNVVGTWYKMDMTVV